MISLGWGKTMESYEWMEVTEKGGSNGGEEAKRWVREEIQVGIAKTMGLFQGPSGNPM